MAERCRIDSGNTNELPTSQVTKLTVFEEERFSVFSFRFSVLR